MKKEYNFIIRFGAEELKEAVSLRDKIAKLMKDEGYKFTIDSWEFSNSYTLE